MRKLFAIIPALAFSAMLAGILTAQAPPATKAAQAPPAAKKAPVTPRRAGEFVIHMPDGTDKLLSSYRGKVIVMAFMYTTCTHCQHTAGVLGKIQTQFAGKDVQIIGVTFDADAKKNVANFIRTFGVNYPCGYSTEDQVKKFLHIAPLDDYFVPMLAFIDRTGTVRSQYIVSDADDSATKFLEEQETSIPKEIDKYLKSSASAGATKQAPKS